jgi:DNA recombination protein RmuC
MPNIVYLLIGVFVGFIAGWIVRTLQAANKPRTEGPLEQELRNLVQQREKELIEVRQELLRAREELAGASARLSVTQEAAEKLRIDFQQQLEQQRVAQDHALASLRDSFRQLSAEALKETHPEFIRLAGETLSRFQAGAAGDLAQRQQAIAGLIQPLKEQLESYQRRLAQAENHQSSALGEVKQHLEALAQHSQALSSETVHLRRILSSNQARGRWGEQTLRRVVEAAGLSVHCDFVEQSQSGESKPDLIVQLPGNRCIIVDAKVPDLDFLLQLDHSDALKRHEVLAAHATKLRGTIRALSERNYPQQFPNALDQVVLFLPAESLFSAALEADQELLLWAAGRQIMLATPASLIALLRSIYMSWQQHAQTENAREIATAAQEFFTRVSKFTEHFEAIRSGLEKANKAYNDSIGSYERMVRPAGERLVSLGASPSGKELASVAPVQTTLRMMPLPVVKEVAE